MREEREAAVELGWVEGVEGDNARCSSSPSCSSPRSRSFLSKYAYNKGVCSTEKKYIELNFDFNLVKKPAYG